MEKCLTSSQVSETAEIFSPSLENLNDSTKDFSSSEARIFVT